MHRLCKASSLSSVVDHSLPQAKIKCPESLQSTALTLMALSLWFVAGSTALTHGVNAKSNSAGFLSCHRSTGVLLVLIRK